jgi:predicted nucleotidyltransferase component of viral defense system
MEICPVAHLDDLVGMKVAAAQGRSEPRDLVDVFSVAEFYGFIELERLGALFDLDFDRDDLRFRLEAGTVVDDEEYMAYGLDRDEVDRLRRFLIAWCDDLSMRPAEEEHLALGMPQVQPTGYLDS